MKKTMKIILSSIVTLLVVIAKADISSASTYLLFQPKLPEDK